MGKKTIPQGFSRLAVILDKLADKHGIGPEHLPGRPELLATAGLEPEDVDREAIQEAQRLHRHEMRRIIKDGGATYAP